MIKVAVSEAAFEAIAATLPLGSVAYEPELSAKGERLVWLEAALSAAPLDGNGGDVNLR